MSKVVIDLHGKTVKEAIQIIENTLITNSEPIEIIVGKGIHSPNCKPKIKIAILNLLEEKKYKHNVNPKNTGRILVKGRK